MEAAATGRPVLVEDLHRADDGLLDFLTHLLDWARTSPIFVLTFGRTELVELRPQWGSGRGGTTLVLEPLDDAAMTAMLDGLVPDLPASAAAAIAGQAEGVPLYAVETVRMLVDRDVIRPIEGVYRLVGDVGELRVPDSLQSLLAARLDALPVDVRAIVADAAVLGSTFPVEAVLALSTRPEAEVRRVLDDLVRREVFSVRADPLSPERGQFGFVQAMLRQVAYDTLSRRERKARHLAVAEHLSAVFSSGGEEISEVVAGHLVDALEAVPNDPDVPELRERAAAALERAADRAVRTGAPVSAARNFMRAADVLEASGSDAVTLAAARLRESAGAQLRIGGSILPSAEQFRRAQDIYRQQGLDRRAVIAGVAAREAVDPRFAAAEDVPATLAELQQAMEVLSAEPDADTVRAIGVFARTETFLGNAAEAEALYRQALVLAQNLGLGDRVVAELLMNYGVTLIFLRRPIEAASLLRESLRRAKAAGEGILTGRVALNLSEALVNSETASSIEAGRTAVTELRSLGARDILGTAYSNLVSGLVLAGDWDAAFEIGRTASADDAVDPWLSLNMMMCTFARGDRPGVERLFADAEEGVTQSGDIQDLAAASAARAVLASTRGEYRDCLTHAERALAVAAENIDIGSEPVRWTWPTAVDAALALGDLGELDRLIDWLAGMPSGQVPTVLHCELALARANRAAFAGDPDPELDAAAVDLARTSRLPLPLARALCAQGERLAASGERGLAAVAATEARPIAERLELAPILARLDRIVSGADISV